MNLPSVPRQQQQQQKHLRIKKQEKTLEFRSRLIEAAEVRFFLNKSPTKDRNDVPQGLMLAAARQPLNFEL
jgi:hypothetical protein